MERQNEIAMMYRDEGVSVQTIGKNVGCSHETARKIVLEAGVRINKKGRIRKDVRTFDPDQVRILYVEENQPITEIARLLKMRQRTVSETLKSLGTSARKMAERKILDFNKVSRNLFFNDQWRKVNRRLSRRNYWRFARSFSDDEVAEPGQ